MSTLEREYFKSLIGRVRGNGSFPDEPLLAVYDEIIAKYISAAQERDILSQRVAELEQALRLHLAVSPDDPLLLTPVEQQLADAKEKLVDADAVMKGAWESLGERVKRIEELKAERDRWYFAANERLVTMNAQEVTIATLTAKVAEVQKQLPEDMQDCTILFKECDLGHGWLTATNWIQHDCPTCHLAASEARVEALEEALTWLLNLHCGVSRFAGDGFHHGVTQAEWNDAIKNGKAQLAALSQDGAPAKTKETR